MNKAPGSFENPSDLFVGNTDKLQRVQKRNIDEIIAVNLRAAEFVPRLGFYATFAYDRYSSMYPRSLIKAVETSDYRTK